MTATTWDKLGENNELLPLKGTFLKNKSYLQNWFEDI